MARRNDWTNLPNGMLEEPADDDVMLIQDVSDTTESPEGTTKGMTRAKVREGLIPESLGVNKGDLIVFSGPGSASSLPVGADGTTPIADSSQPLGIRWGASTSDSGSTYDYIQDEAEGAPATPLEGQTWFAPDTGNTYLYFNDGATTQWVQSATSNSSPVGDSPTFTGVVTHDGAGNFFKRTGGGGVYLTMESDTANYISFKDDNGNSQGYIDVPTDSNTFLIRNALGNVFLQYDGATGQVTFPDGGVPASDVVIEDLGGYFTASELEDVLQEIGLAGGVSTIGGLSDVTITSPTTGQAIAWDGTKWVNTTVFGTGAVDSVNGQTGVVVVDADDISDAATTNKFATQAELDKLAAIEALADVTDTANVTAAGALMDSEVTNLNAIKSFDPGDYATAAQGALADTALQTNAVPSVNGQTGAVVLDPDDLDDTLTTNKFTTEADQNKLATVETGSRAPASVRYAVAAGTVTNAGVVIQGQGPTVNQTVELQYVPYDGARTLLATVTITTTAGFFACPVFSQALRVVTDGNGSITNADGIAVVITAGPSLPPPIVTFA